MNDELYQTVLEEIRKCFTGLCQYGAVCAAADVYTSDLREFTLHMVEFWGLDNETDGDRYEQDFDRAVSEADASGTAPELTDQEKDDILKGLDDYLTELECTGGQDQTYKNCKEFSDSLKIAWGRGTMELLEHRLDTCLMDRFTDLGHSPGFEALHTFGWYVEMHEYLTCEHDFEQEELNRLLRFENPLETAVECGNMGRTLSNLNLSFYLDRMNAEDIYPQAVSERPTPKMKPPIRKRGRIKDKVRHGDGNQSADSQREERTQKKGTQAR